MLHILARFKDGYLYLASFFPDLESEFIDFESLILQHGSITELKFDME